MKRWHDEVSLLKKFNRERKSISVDDKQEYPLGKFRKHKPLGCPCTKKRGLCKIHKLGNSKSQAKPKELRSVIRAKEEMESLNDNSKLGSDSR